VLGRLFTVRYLFAKLALGVLLIITQAFAEQIPVKYPEGLTHGFLLLRSDDGKIIASGDLIQTVQGSVVTSKLEFHFQDGSVHEETTVFSQRKFFRLLSYHLLETGPSFKSPSEIWIDRAKGEVQVRDMKNGKNKIIARQISLPPGLANGLISTVIKDFADNAPHTVSMLAATPKPRIVKMEITPEGEESFTVGGNSYKARRYVGKIKIGGIAGAIAPIVGNQPPDSHFWILRGDAPAFLKSKGPLTADTPVWQIELASPEWPDKQTTKPNSRTKPNSETKSTKEIPPKFSILPTYVSGPAEH
jgi:hypothetical protein